MARRKVEKGAKPSEQVGDDQTEGYMRAIEKAEPKAGPPVRKPARELGVTRVTVTAGEETFSPVKFMTFHVGPISAEIELGPDDVVEDRIEQVREMLERQMRSMFERKLEAFRDRVAQTGRD